MVNIAEIIRRKKQEFANYKQRKSQQDNINRAEELQRLKEERIRLEGKAKLEMSRQDELSRIKSAREKTPNRLMAFGQGLANVVNKGKAQSKKVGKGKVYGKAFTGGNPFGGESKGMDFGGHKDISFTGARSPFNEASRPKAVKPKKRGDITIRIAR